MTTNNQNNSVDIRDLFPTRYLSGYDLRGKTPTVKISHIGYEDVRDASGETKTIAVLFFEKSKKGLRLNKTIAKSIAKIHSNDTGQWPGKSVALFATDIKAFGEVHSVVRVRASHEKDG